MKMHKKAGLSVGVLAAVTMLIAPAAFATSTLSVDGATSPVGNVAVTGAMKGSNVSFLTDAGTPASCTSSAVSGYVIRGASVTNGTKIGAITNQSFTSCTATGLNYAVTIAKDTKAGSPAEWPIQVVGNPAKGAAVVNIVIKNVKAQMNSTGATPWACELVATGDLTGTFTQATQRIKITGGASAAFPLSIVTYNGAGTKTPSSAGKTCGAQIWDIDKANFTGEFTLATPGVGGIHF